MATVTAPPIGRPAVAPNRLGKSPSRSRYWIAGIVASVGMVAAIGWGASEALDAYRNVDTFPRAEIPGVVTVRVTDPGERVLYYEGDRDPLLGELGIEVTDPAGNTVGLTAYEGDLRYDFDGRVAKAVASFDARVTGDYVIVARSVPEPGATLAAGEDFAGVVSTILAALGLALVALIVGIAIVGIAYSQRSTTPDGKERS